ncbi:MAG: DUF559 domain-containing protein [Anaerolineae bacterium]|nr:DUF559 domain-containing protein [Anaerolineae bacterium]
MSVLTPQQFVEKWRNTPLGERQSYQLHFLDVCQLVAHEAPGGDGRDRDGRIFAFEYGVKKDSGGQGFADVFYDGRFAVEYKAPGKYADLEGAYQQLLKYRERLNNPPLLVVTDILTWEIHTNWPATEKKVYRFTHDEIMHRPSVRGYLEALFTAPEKLHPRRNTAQVTTDAADVFRVIADDMRREGAEDVAGRIAHFLTKLVFCLFAEDVALLPQGPGHETGIFAEIVERTQREPARFMRYAQELFTAMASGGEVMFQKIPYFNGSLFDDVAVEPISLEALGKLADAAKLNWQSVEPAIFGTLFERSLDPSKRAQLGAHYTSREDILLIVEPVLMQPLRREWAAIQAEAAPIRAKLEQASTPRERIQAGDALKKLRERMLKRLREIKVLDPACGSGNFLYVSLQLLMDMEKAVLNDPLFEGLEMAIPEVHPRQMYGIELNPIAHDLASIVVWIGYIQWRQNNGYATYTRREPILQALKDNIRQMDAIMQQPHPKSASNTPHPKSLSMHGEGLEDSVSDSPSHAWRGAGGEVHEIENPVRNAPPELWEKLKPLAQQMRHEPTPAEEQLWAALRNRQVAGAKFRRQHVIDRFILDFFCPEAWLVVEVDGPIHDYTVEEDAIRQAFLEAQGLRVLRFRNEDVMQRLPQVLEQVTAALNTPRPKSASNAPHPKFLSMHGEGLEDSVPDSPLHTWRGAGGEVTAGGEVAPTEPDWPEVDVIVGNPPFLGGNKIRGELGDAYVNNLFLLYEGRVPAFADLVCYWFEKARAHLAAGKAKRAGLLATNSIRGGVNRRVLERIRQSGDIVMAWSDRDWVLDGANVRVSMVGFTAPPGLLSTSEEEEQEVAEGEREQRFLDGRPVSSINADLTEGVDITIAKQLIDNLKICFIGTKKAGPFDISAEYAAKLLRSPNESNRDNRDVVFQWLNGERIVRNAPERWIINFGEMSEDVASLYIEPFKYVRENIYPIRQKNNEERARVKWWQHRRPATEMREAATQLSRIIATPRVSKYRLFAWYPSSILPDDGIYIFAREDDYFFGVLHSRLHEVWSLRMGTWLGVGNDPRYTPTTTFETFPFPWPPGQEDVNSAAYQAVAAAAKQLHEERAAWQQPHPKSLSMHGEGLEESDSPLYEWRGAGGEVKRDRTLTNLYNALAVWRGQAKMKVTSAAGDFAPRLADLHDALDAAVCAAYDWPTSILSDEEEMLRRLLALNLARAT